MSVAVDPASMEGVDIAKHQMFVYHCQDFCIRN